MHRSMQVVIRTDSSFAMATGHVTRCLALEAELHRRGATTSFVTRALPGDAAFLIREQGVALHRLPAPRSGDVIDADGPSHASWLGETWANDARQTEAVLEGNVDWLVVDHYGLDARWESRFREKGTRVLVIDDLADRPHDADVLVDPNFAPAEGEPYEGLLPAGARILRGPAYSLLRPEFRRIRERRGPPRRPARILVFLGGSDAPDVTGRVLDGFENGALRDIELDIVAGVSNPRGAELRARAEAMGARFHERVREMAETMLSADLAIGAGGGTAWERCCLGLPAVLVSLEANQVRIARTLHDRGAAVYVGHHDTVSAGDIVSEVTRLVRQPDLLTDMSRKGMDLVDGLGVCRIADVMEQPAVRL